jgi:integrase
MPKYKHGSGTVYLRGHTWWISYSVKGTQVWESARTRDKAEARRVLRAKLGKIAEGHYAGPAMERVTFDELAEGILNDYRINGRKTAKWVERRTRLHLRPFFGAQKAQETTSQDVQAFILHRHDLGASNGEIGRELACLKRMFNLALQAEKIIRKPYIPTLTEDNVRKGFFERIEFDAVLAKLPEYLRPPVTFAYQVGWRVMSEVLLLTWEQVDLEVGTVRLEVGTTKTKKGRLVYLPNLLRGVLESQWREHLAYYPDCPYVFHRSGNEIRYPYVAWRRACKEAALAGKIPHDFRRTAVRNMARAGIPERVAMEIAGHKTRSIFDRYHIVSEGDLKEAAERLDAAFEAQTMTKTMTTDCCEVTAPSLRH